MLKIRLMRIGAKKRPFYRIVVVDERKKRTGGYLDLIGTYNPLTDPKEIKIDQTKVDEWTKKGAQPSDGFLRIIGKAPQRQPRKPKKEKAVSSGSVGQQVGESVEKPVEVAQNEAIETPAEEVAETAAEEAVAEAPVVSEESIVEAEPAESAEAAAEVLTGESVDQSVSESDNTENTDSTEHTESTEK